MRIRTLPRTLYIIAPTMMECVLAARDFGLVEGQVDHHRNITRAYLLRGTQPGTPFLARARNLWSVTPESDQLAAAVDTLQAMGRLRIVRADELDLYRSYAGVPNREARA